jgi:protein-disulfide isomerase
MKARSRPWLAWLPVAVILGCVSPAEIEQIRDEQGEIKKGQREIKDGQEQILARLEAMQKVITAPAPTPPPRAEPDPNKVYAFPAGDSPSKGPGDAWVTIVEVSEFQ